jgi:hypothetical protein
LKSAGSHRSKRIGHPSRDRDFFAAKLPRSWLILAMLSRGGHLANRRPERLNNNAIRVLFRILVTSLSRTSESPRLPKLEAARFKSESWSEVVRTALPGLVYLVRTNIMNGAFP